MAAPINPKSGRLSVQLGKLYKQRLVKLLKKHDMSAAQFFRRAIEREEKRTT